MISHLALDGPCPYVSSEAHPGFQSHHPKCSPLQSWADGAVRPFFLLLDPDQPPCGHDLWRCHSVCLSFRPRVLPLLLTAVPCLRRAMTPKSALDMLISTSPQMIPHIRFLTALLKAIAHITHAHSTHDNTTHNNTGLPSGCKQINNRDKKEDFWSLSHLSPLPRGNACSRCGVDMSRRLFFLPLHYAHRYKWKCINACGFLKVHIYVHICVYIILCVFFCNFLFKLKDGIYRSLHGNTYRYMIFVTT